jgi:hypothetical protein
VSGSGCDAGVTQQDRFRALALRLSDQVGLAVVVTDTLEPVQQVTNAMKMETKGLVRRDHGVVQGRWPSVVRPTIASPSHARAAKPIKTWIQ